MTVHDRLRATTEAVSGTMREVRPLTLPPEQPGRAAPPRERRRRSGWLVPITAAAAVIAVAATLVAVRSVHTTAPASPANPDVGVVTAIPRYYVQIGGWTPGSSQQGIAIVGDSRTGRKLATVKPPKGLAFEGVVGATDTFKGWAGASNDRLFVLVAASVTHISPENPSTAASANRSWYLLRIAPGTAHPATLTKLAITGPNDAAEITGLALSPGAGTLAVYYQNDAMVGAADPYTLRLFSVSTGRVLRTWTAPGKDLEFWSVPDQVNASDLAWAGTSQTLAFTFPPFPQGTEESSDERTLNVSGSLGGSLLGDSRSVYPDPGSQNNCSSMLLSADGRTLVCSTTPSTSGGCHQQEPQFELYSAATGKIDQVLYRHSSCLGAAVGVVWAGSAGTAIGVIQKSDADGLHATVGVVTPGRFTPLRVPVPRGYGDLSGQLAF
jgi:hypothetical protein